MLLIFEGGSEIRVRNEVLAASWFAIRGLRTRGIGGDILKAVDKAQRVLATCRESIGDSPRNCPRGWLSRGDQGPTEVVSLEVHSNLNSADSNARSPGPN
jgi:hypothetical protein